MKLLVLFRLSTLAELLKRETMFSVILIMYYIHAYANPANTSNEQLVDTSLLMRFKLPAV
jgi:hypothetical protein